MSADDVAVDTETLREEVRDKYRKVAADPTAQFHFFSNGQAARGEARLQRGRC